MLLHPLPSRRLLLAGLAFLLSFSDAARANIISEDHTRGDNASIRGDINHEALEGGPQRMGVADFEGTTYYACIATEGKNVLIAPADDRVGGWPSSDPGQGVVLTTPREGVTGGKVAPGSGIYVNEVTFINGLFVRDGQLYVVFETRGTDDSDYRQIKFRGNHVFMQALRSQKGTKKLVPYGKLYDIAPQNSLEELSFAGVVSGDDGIYLHIMYSNGPLGNVYIETYLLADNPGDEDRFKRVSGDESLSPDKSCREQGMQLANDAVGTHEFNAQGKLEEVHYIAWALGQHDTSGHVDRTLMLARYVPHPAGGGGATYDVKPTGFKLARDYYTHSTLTLLEGSMRGNPSADYGITIVELGVNQHGQRATPYRTLFYSTVSHSFVGDWTDIDLPLDAGGGGLRLRTLVHWGINKDGIVPDGKEEELGPDGVKFFKAMQQSFLISTLAYLDGNTVFRSSRVQGNRFATDPTLGNEDGVSVVNTADALSKDGDNSHFHAWSLIGVIHGIPPYIPFVDGHGYPSIEYTFSSSIGSTTGISQSAEDSKEVTISASTGGAAAQGVFSAEASYTYGIKTADGTSTTDSIASSKTASQTFKPSVNSGPFAPDNLGQLIYSAPQFTSKAYRVRRWDTTPFNGPNRNIFITAVSSRSLQLITYRLDDPDGGPVVGVPRHQEPALKELTKGIAPVSPTSRLGDWRNSPVPDINKFPSFKNNRGTLTATLDSGGKVIFSYLETHADGSTHAETKSSKSTVKVSGGISGLFNISVTGSTASSSTFSTTTTTTTSLGTGFTVDYPQLWTKDGPDGKPLQKVSSIQAEALLVYPDGVDPNQKPAPTWIPNAYKGTNAPFLLTWKLNSVSRPSLARKSWQLHGHRDYVAHPNGPAPQ